MPTAGEWDHDDRDRADTDLIRGTARWLREDPDRARDTGLARNEDAHALAALLDILATELPHLDTMVRRQTTESCRVPGLAHPGPPTCQVVLDALLRQPGGG